MRGRERESEREERGKDCCSERNDRCVRRRDASSEDRKRRWMGEEEEGEEVEYEQMLSVRERERRQEGEWRREREEERRLVFVQVKQQRRLQRGEE